MSEIKEIFSKKPEQAYKCFFCKVSFTERFVKRFGLMGTETKIKQFFHVCQKCLSEETPCPTK